MPIEGKKLCKSFGETQVLRELSFCVQEGETVWLSGRSGIGKTTLLRILMGLEQPDSGTVCGLEGKRLSAVFQEDRLCENLSTLSNIRLVVGHTVAEREILDTLKSVGLREAANQPVREQSGGMKRRIAIVRAVLAPFDILFLDEPFSGLDLLSKDQAIRFILKESKGKTVFLVTHNPDEAQMFGAREIALPDLHKENS